MKTGKIAMDAREMALMEDLLIAIKEKTNNGVALDQLARGIVTRMFDGVAKEKFSNESNQFMDAYQQQFGVDVVNGNQCIMLTENNCQKLLSVMHTIRDSIMGNPTFKTEVLDKLSNETRARVYHDLGVAVLNRVTGKITANVATLDKKQRDNVAANMEFANRVYKNHDTNPDEVFNNVKQEFKSDLESEMFQRLGIMKDNANAQSFQEVINLTSIKESMLAENIANLSKYKQDLAKNTDNKNHASDFNRSNKILASVPPQQKAAWVHKAEFDALQKTIEAARTLSGAVENVSREQANQLADNILKITVKQDKELGQELKARNLTPKQSTAGIFKSLATLMGKKNEKGKSIEIEVAIEKPEEKNHVKFKEEELQTDAKNTATFGRRSQVIPNSVHKQAERYASMSRSGLMETQKDLKTMLSEEGKAEKKEPEKADVTSPNFFRRP